MYHAAVVLSCSVAARRGCLKAAAGSDYAAPEHASNDPLPSLASLADEFATDKGRANHKYTDVYGALFDGLRPTVRNLTEVGVETGGSLLMWRRYFPVATVWGLDPQRQYPSKMCTTSHHRLRYLNIDGGDRAAVVSAGLANGSMDVIIDDAGWHDRKTQERVFSTMWPLLRVWAARRTVCVNVYVKQDAL